MKPITLRGLSLAFCFFPYAALARLPKTTQTTTAPAKIQALANSHFTAGGYGKGSSKGRFIEGLFPVTDSSQRMLFVQGGWHRHQQRNQFNVGLGQRHFLNPHWMLGYNLFFDQDTTQHHSRGGIGAELWHDTVKLAANGYFPLSSQRITPSNKKEQAQAASGFDLSLTGHLPAVPQLSASVKYAQFLGADVAVVNTSQRQKNPKSWTLGLGYTPIPLLTVDYHYLAGQTRPSPHQLGFSLTYRFATPLRQQLDPRQVATIRSYQGQRFDRVQRQKEMILKYTQVNEATPAGAGPGPNPAILQALQARVRTAEARFNTADTDFLNAEANSNANPGDLSFQRALLRAEAELRNAQAELDAARAALAGYAP